MVFEQLLDLIPSFRFGRIGILFLGFDAALFFKRNDVCPSFAIYRFFDVFIVVAAVGQHHHLFGIVGTDVVFKVNLF